VAFEPSGAPVGLTLDPSIHINSNFIPSNVYFLGIPTYTRVLNVFMLMKGRFTSLVMSSSRRQFTPSASSIPILAPIFFYLPIPSLVFLEAGATTGSTMDPGSVAIPVPTESTSVLDGPDNAVDSSNVIPAQHGTHLQHGICKPKV
jgi:hypothetical protein